MGSLLLEARRYSVICLLQENGANLMGKLEIEMRVQSALLQLISARTAYDASSHLRVCRQQLHTGNSYISAVVPCTGDAFFLPDIRVVENPQSPSVVFLHTHQ